MSDKMYVWEVREDGGECEGISDQFKIPVRYIGLGEGMEHLQVFDKRAFVETLFGE